MPVCSLVCEITYKWCYAIKMHGQVPNYALPKPIRLVLVRYIVYCIANHVIAKTRPSATALAITMHLLKKQNIKYSITCLSHAYMSDKLHLRYVWILFVINSMQYYFFMYYCNQSTCEIYDVPGRIESVIMIVYVKEINDVFLGSLWGGGGGGAWRLPKPLLHYAFFGGVGADNAKLFVLGTLQTDLWPTRQYIFEKKIHSILGNMCLHLGDTFSVM